LVKDAKDTEMERQKGHFRGFSEPWLALVSLWLAWAPKLLRAEGTNSPG